MSELQDLLSEAVKEALTGATGEEEAEEPSEEGEPREAEADSQLTAAAQALGAPSVAEPSVDAPAGAATADAEAAAGEITPAEPGGEGEAAVAVAETEVEIEAAEALEEEEEEEEQAPSPASPYDLPGGWYVVHSYSGYENKVKANLESRIKSMHMEDRIFDVVIPMEDVVEFKGGRKVTVKKKVFPGYILVRLYMDDDAWFVVRNTPGVTGFVGSGTKPTSLSRKEVERILGVSKAERKKVPRFKPEWEVGETVRVVEGPFADFNGVIEDINIDQSKVRVLVDIFGRETPVELNFEQIQKY